VGRDAKPILALLGDDARAARAPTSIITADLVGTIIDAVQANSADARPIPSLTAYGSIRQSAMLTARVDVAIVVGARVLIITVRSRPGLAIAHAADVLLGAGIPIIARNVVRDVHASCNKVTVIIGA